MVRSEKTRQYIIENTAAIFNKKGYAGTHLSDLTAATGLTKGSIYGNFKDKNEVAVEAFKYNYQFQVSKLKDNINENDHAADQLVAFLSHYKTEFLAIFNNGGCAILNTAVDADDGNESLKLEVIKSIKQWKQTIVSMLEHGKKNNQIKIVDSSTFSLTIIALIEGSILLAKTLEQPKILFDNIDYLIAEINKIRIQE